MRLSAVFSNVGLLACFLLPAGARDAVSQHDWLHAIATEKPPRQITGSVLELNPEMREKLLEGGWPFIDMLVAFELNLTSSGTLERRTTVARRLLNEEGVRNYGNLSVSVGADVEQLYVDHAAVRSPDGTFRAIDLRQIQVVNDTSPNAFSDRYNVFLPFENVTVDSTLILETRSVRQVGQWPLPWSEMIWPQRHAPLGRFELQLTWPSDGEAPVWATDAEFLDCRKSERTLRCTSDDVPALSTDEEALTFLEWAPQLVIAARHTWSELARTEAALVQRSVSDTGDITGLLNGLVAGSESKEEMLDRIHRFVADEIRYVGLEHGTSAVVPRPVARTLHLRYGDCKDKVATFVALARRAGLDAYPVLVATHVNDPADLILPAWKYFDHMIACVGREAPVCLDLTAPGMRTGDLPPALYGTVALDLFDGVTAPRLLDTPEFVWLIDVEARNRLQCDGRLIEETTRSFDGPGGGLIRSMLSGMTAENLERWAVADYQAVMGDDAEPDVRVGTLDDPRRAVTLDSVTEFDLQAAAEIEFYSESDAWLIHHGIQVDTSRRTRPYSVAGLQVETRLSYEVCADFRVQFLGPALELEGRFGKLTRKYRLIDGSVEVGTTLTVPSQRIEPEDIEDFRRFLSRALDQTQVWFSLTDRRGQSS